MADARRFHLRRTEDTLGGAALLPSGGERVGIAGVVDDLGRQGRPAFLGGRLLGRAVRRAFTWDATDRRDPEWWPQGITTSADAAVDDRMWGRPLILTSWYSRREAGSRISVIDLDSMRYEHVLLVAPRRDPNGEVHLDPLRIHAGGIVWLGEHLHLAATARGLMTCRIDDIVRVDNHFGHRFALPVRFTYDAVTADGHERLRYSFVSLDRSADPMHLVVGEYGATGRTHRLARFPLDPETDLLALDEDGTALPVDLDEGGTPRTQGAVTVHGQWYLTASNGPWGPGTVYTGGPGRWRTHRWVTPMGPEDITWWPQTDQFWSLSEWPRRRWVYAMDRSWFDH